MSDNTKSRTYVGAVTVVAIAMMVALVRYAGAPNMDAIQAAAVLGLMALVAELLSYVLPRSASGSVSFIPYFAAIVIAPGWLVPLAAAAIRASLEFLQKRSRLKVLFNTAQACLTLSVAALAYSAFRGTPLLEIPHATLLYAGRLVAFPAIGAFTIALLLHSISVSTAIALSSSEPARQVWRANSLLTIGLDLAAGPLVLVFAWVYVRFGGVAAAALWVPILGLRQVHRANLELEQMNEELLQLMVKSIEARDPYTSGHSRRVQHYALLVARAIGLSETEIAEVSRAALLHDVGKIYEKYGPILRKPDRLTPEEWAIMHEHPADGANLVATMTRLKSITPAIRHHHENWDGTGYPDGIAGERIPIASRVIMFADTIDAMTTERPYRGPLSEDMVRSEFVRCRGRQFDPRLTDLLLSSSLWRQIFADRPAISGSVPLKLVEARSREFA